MIVRNHLYDFDDLLIQPATVTSIRSRKSQVNARYGNHLPLMTAPMDTVIDRQNIKYFTEAGILPVLPRTDKAIRSVSFFNFLSYGLEDFEKVFLSERVPIPREEIKMYALIDVANGHIGAVMDVAKKAKQMYGGRLSLMVGNVANPNTFETYCQIGVDYVRVGIGNGGGCLTTVQTGVGYPMASLIDECYHIKAMKHYGTPQTPYTTKIVADGGFKKYSDVIKALALGADYVMLGSILNKALESAGETSREDGTVVDQYAEGAELFKVDVPLYKNFRGMSTKEVQKSWGKKELTTSEGVVRRHKVEYTLKGWVENFEAYLKSAMSYAGHKELHQFIGGAVLNTVTQNAVKRFDK